MSGYHQGGQAELAMLRQIGLDRVKAQLGQDTLASRMANRVSGQDRITERMMARDAARRDSQAESAATAADRDIKEATPETAPGMAKRVGIDLDELTGGLPRAQGPDVVYRVPTGQTGPLPLKSPQETSTSWNPFSWLPERLLGGESPQAPKEVSLFERKTAPLATAGSLLDIQRSLAQGSPLVTSRSRGGPYLPRADFLARQEEQNPSVARGRAARQVQPQVQLGNGVDPLPTNDPAPSLFPRPGLRDQLPQPVGGAPNGNAPVNEPPITAEAIREQFRTGKITREQARAALQTLGIGG